MIRLLAKLYESTYCHSMHLLFSVLICLHSLDIRDSGTINYIVLFFFNIIQVTYCLFVLMLYVPVNNFSVKSGRLSIFLGLTNTKQRLKCLAQGHNTVTPVSLKLATL